MPVLPALPGALAHAGGAGRRRRRGGVRGLERPRLLRPVPQPARVRADGPGAARRAARVARGLGALPGLGPYTAGAVASIAFGDPGRGRRRERRARPGAAVPLRGDGPPRATRAALGARPRPGRRAGRRRIPTARADRATGTRHSWSWGRRVCGGARLRALSRWPRSAPRAGPGVSPRHPGPATARAANAARARLRGDRAAGAGAPAPPPGAGLVRGAAGLSRRRGPGRRRRAGARAPAGLRALGNPVAVREELATRRSRPDSPPTCEYGVLVRAPALCAAAPADGGSLRFTSAGEAARLPACHRDECASRPRLLRAGGVEGCAPSRTRPDGEGCLGRISRKALTREGPTV